MPVINLIVECTMNEEGENLIESLGKIKYRLPMINSYIVEISADKKEKLKGLKGIKNVYQTTSMKVQMDRACKLVKAYKAQTYNMTGQGVSIAILDTGVSPVNDLVKPYNRIIGFYDFINGAKSPYDDNGHGTHV